MQKAAMELFFQFESLQVGNNHKIYELHSFENINIQYVSHLYTNFK